MASYWLAFTLTLCGKSTGLRFNALLFYADYLEFISANKIYQNV